MTERITLKIIVLGDSFVGKTSLINQFVNRKYSSEYKSTIGVDLSTKVISIKDQLVSLQIWDPSGTERFRCISESFFRGTDGCVLVCSVTSIESFNSFESWMSDIINHIGYNVPFVAVANKSDLDPIEWQVTSNRLDTWCKKKNIPSFFVSAKDASNVENAFIRLSEDVLINNSTKQSTVEITQINLNQIKQNSQNSPNQKDSCC
ncbi:Rab family GTPase [Entamoeba histolytica HM-1:IMSS-B]|uniref:Rab family GTPase n=6 Tax=Entamoeba histolytica TaxID=5759 RepID=A0A8U0WPH2_ENTH1|eukprot:XP_650041.1 Rab family GTPase [Entamoeba histolytica HM-1:IMSS]